MSFFGFHPIVEKWFHSRFHAPTEPQQLGWPAIAALQHTLIAAPTGSGKTLTAFLAVIDRLLRQSLDGQLKEETRVVYVSPLRALSNDMHRNLETPLQEIFELIEVDGITTAAGLPLDQLKVGLRTGDTSASRRAALVRRPPHILVTTPESLYLMLTAEKGRQTMKTVDTVIVDEIHALVRDKRGSHLALTLERLQHVSETVVQRIGLSATQKPIERMAEFLVGQAEEIDRPGTSRRRVSERLATSLGETGLQNQATSDAKPPCEIIDVGHSRQLDLAIEVPPSVLGAVCMHEQWAEVNQRIVNLINEHRSTLIFVNTRRLAERVTHNLSQLLGDDAVGSHHGSLSSDIRLKTERQLKSGELKAVVATASLELGLDIGYIDLVIQIGSPRSIATFLQRIGRSGHSLGLIPKGRLFALTRDEAIECMALIRAVRAGRLDVTVIPDAPLDVLAQQIVAEVAAEEWQSDALFELFRRAFPYRGLSREDFDSVVEFLSEGITRSSGRSRVYLHHDRVGRRLRARKGARIPATSNAGAIPEIASFRVVTEPDQTVVGTLDEDFAIESHGGSIFLLGNTSWRIQHVRGGDVTVTDAGGAPPTIPFWRGEAPGRTLELSEEVSRLREDIEQRIASFNGKPQASALPGSQLTNVDADQPAADARSPFSEATAWLAEETSCSEFAAEQIVEYIAAQHAAIGLVPTQKRIGFERFFDESGGMQMVIHAPFGASINQAWGLAMRKRFCRSFDFELQASADDNGFILSLGPQHSFPLESMFSMLNAQNVQPLLKQALLAIPMFQIRWRWNATRALLVLRRQNGKKVPPNLQRFRSDDLLTAVFPKLTGCQENVVGDIEVPGHPLVRQTMHDCLHEALDIDGLINVLGGIGRGEIEVVGRDTREPSPFCYELLNAHPYAFLDGGEIQERRTRAVSSRRTLAVESVRDLGRLDPAAIEQVRREAQPLVRDADELHDLLLTRFLLPESEAADYADWMAELSRRSRATEFRVVDEFAACVAAERLPAIQSMFPNAVFESEISVPDGVQRDWTAVDARIAVVRGLLETAGPTTSELVAQQTGITSNQASAALEALEGEGVVLRGRFTPSSALETTEPTNKDQTSHLEWCHRRLLARIHRLTIEGLRRQIEPVDVSVFIRFLARHHGLIEAERRSGTNGLFEVVSMLQGIDIPSVCWERDILPTRVRGFRPESLDELCLSGEVAWARLFPPKRNKEKSRPMASITRVAPISVFLRADAGWLTSNSIAADADELSSPAVEVLELLDQRGAAFAADLIAETQMLPSQLEQALGELVTRGLVTSDGFSGLRRLANSDTANRQSQRRRRSRGIARTRGAAAGIGRWSLWRVGTKANESNTTSQLRDTVALGVDRKNERDAVEQWAWQLLRRWGVVFRDLLVRENGAPRWFRLLQVYRRLEARGEIRGGRFVAGVAGEQFALGETVRKLRQLRDEESGDELTVVSAADPLNLTGILTDHARVPSTASNRVAYLNGNPVAALISGDVHILEEIPAAIRSLVAGRLKCRELIETSFILPSELDCETPASNDSREEAADSDESARESKKTRRMPSGIPRPIIS